MTDYKVSYLECDVEDEPCDVIVINTEPEEEEEVYSFTFKGVKY